MKTSLRAASPSCSGSGKQFGGMARTRAAVAGDPAPGRGERAAATQCTRTSSGTAAGGGGSRRPSRADLRPGVLRHHGGDLALHFGIKPDAAIATAWANPPRCSRWRAWRQRDEMLGPAEPFIALRARPGGRTDWGTGVVDRSAPECAPPSASAASLSAHLERAGETSSAAIATRRRSRRRARRPLVPPRA